MSSLAMEFGDYDLPVRNALASQTIEQMALSHAAIDVAIGLGGFLPIPGAGTASMLAALTAQIPLYKARQRVSWQRSMSPLTMILFEE